MKRSVNEANGIEGVCGGDDSPPAILAEKPRKTALRRRQRR
jgi:hypothetical protein